jgi:hypothetical protein
MAAGWHITGQRQSSVLNGNGGFDDVMEISFQTDPEGISGSVKVPLRVYSDESVRNAVDELAKTMKAVHNL